MMRNTAVFPAALTLPDAMIADHERSTGPREIGWIARPEAFMLTAGAFAHSRFLVEGLEVDEDRMRANLDMTNVLVVSEAVMMGLAPCLGREYAHDLVYDICRVALTKNRSLLDLLCENAETAQHPDRTVPAKLCDPANYRGLAGVRVDRVLERLVR